VKQHEKVSSFKGLFKFGSSQPKVDGQLDIDGRKVYSRGIGDNIDQFLLNHKIKKDGNIDSLMKHVIYDKKK